MNGLTFDTGALIGLERRNQRIGRIFRHAISVGQRITVPAAVVSEWWRGATDARALILHSVDVEPLDEELARAAGEALGHVRKAATIDAIVMASAARRGDVVYTSDYDDLERLRGHFGAVPRVLCV
jgi:predicted nucleic acid-binding protein